MDTLVAIGILVGGCLIIWGIGKIIEKITGFPVWGSDDSPGGLPHP